MNIHLSLFTLCLLLHGASWSMAQAVDADRTKESGPVLPANELFEKLIGKWEGSCRTWFEPDKLADESTVSGEFSLVFNRRFLRHEYTGSMQGKPRQGEELIAFNSIAKQYQVSWVDDFHMSQAIMFSEGEATVRGFRVLGEYDAGENHPRWGWRTNYALLDDDHLTVTAYNITPEGIEAKAVETTYHRAKPAER